LILLTIDPDIPPSLFPIPPSTRLYVLSPPHFTNSVLGAMIWQ
jgi:hypothetical protein